MYLEEMHNGTNFKKRDRSGQIQRQVLIPKGMRQGSVEGPLIFVAFKDLVLHGMQARRGATEMNSISARSWATLSGDEVVAPVNEIAFVDDILSFLIFRSWEHLTGWIQEVIEVFETNHLKANVGKLEVLLEAVGHGNARMNREISAGKVEIMVGGHRLVPKKKAVYLGVSLNNCGSVAGEIEERMTKAKRARARLANNVWKSRLFTWNVKWRLWQGLVLSVMIYCLEAHTLTGVGNEATRCLRQIARVPAHVTHVSNNALRRQYMVATIGSILARRRLLFWRKILRPWAVKNGRHDTSLLPRLVCLGMLSFKEESDEPRQTLRMELLSKDLILLRDALSDCAGGGSKAERVLQSADPVEAELMVRRAPVEPITARPSDAWLKWLASLSDPVISTVLTWDGGRHDEDTQRICPTCGCTC